MLCFLAAHELARDVVIPDSYDYRLVGLQTYAFYQKSCGSCWAATVANAAESGLLRARTALGVYESTSTLRVSTYWIMDNSDSNSGCDGGDFYVGAYDIYRFGGNFARESEIPYKGTSGAETEVEHVFSELYTIYEDYSAPLDPHGEEARMMKYLISRGIPVVAVMSLGSMPWLQRQFIANWNGDVLRGACTRIIDHYVVIVGYGMYKGVPCWLVKNSWGSGFGQFGYFYIEIGSDTLCIERSAAAALPVGFSFAEDVYTAERAEHSGLEFIYAKTLKTGKASFDREDGSYSNWRYVGYLTVFEGAVGIFATALLLGMLVGIRRRIKDGRWIR